MKSGENTLLLLKAKSALMRKMDGFYEKHKIFLYKEDFDKFADGLEAVVNFIRTGIKARRQFRI